jgi:FemAB-related protein (PEP-CTERM system-associated)
MTIAIQELAAHDAGQERAWDHFVRASDHGTPFHLLAWKRVVETVFRMQPHYLLATEAGEVRGVLPLFEVRGLLSGHVVVSVPYGVYGGLCSEDGPARAALLEAARRLPACRTAKYVELRHVYAPEAGLPTKSRYVVFAKAIGPDPEANLEAIPRKQRRMIRQGMKHGLEARRGWDELPAFYEVYLANRQRLGSPAFPRRLFEAIQEQFGHEAQLLTIWHGSLMVSGVISLFYGKRVMPYYGAALEEAFGLAVNDFMYWEVMRQASLDGYEVFDFGRSREGTGPYHFKRHWGFEPQPLPYQYLFLKASRIPDHSPSNPRLQFFIRTWKHLPMPVTRRIGPILTHRLPLD